MALTEFRRQLLVECHFLDNRNRRVSCDLRVNEYTADSRRQLLANAAIAKHVEIIVTPLTG